MRTSILVGAKNFRFFKIYGVSARTRRASQFGHFANKCGKEPIFSICAYFFMDGP